MRYTELRDYKIHKGAVVDSYINAEKNFMYSIGEDKYLRLFNFKTKQVINNNQLSKSKLTKMIVHEESQTAFVTTKGGELILVDISNVSFIYSFNEVLIW